jgi:hypothetical protein
MADVAFNTYGNASDLEAFLVQQDTGDAFRKLPKNQVAHAVGFTASDKGKIPYIDANGDFTNLAAGTDGFSLLLASGVPVWANNPSSVRLLLTQTGSGATSIDFTTGFDSTYDAYMFILVNVYPSTDATSILMRVSENAGSSFIATGYETSATIPGTASGTINGSTTSHLLTALIEASNVATEAMNGEVKLMVSTTKAAMVHSVQYMNDGGTTRHVVGGGAVATTSRTNGVRFLASSGNINGTIHMLGVKNV